MRSTAGRERLNEDCSSWHRSREAIASSGLFILHHHTFQSISLVGAGGQDLLTRVKVKTVFSLEETIQFLKVKMPTWNGQCQGSYSTRLQRIDRTFQCADLRPSCNKWLPLHIPEGRNTPGRYCNICIFVSTQCDIHKKTCQTNNICRNRQKASTQRAQETSKEQKHKSRQLF